MKTVYRLSLVLSVGLLLLAPSSVFAQTTGDIEGTVTDQSGAALPGVTVEATSPNLQGTRTATTGSDGRYRFVSLPPGQYRVAATLAGMGSAQKNTNVQLDTTATVNLRMRLVTSESVTVTAAAPLVDTRSTTTGTNYTSKVIESLPVARNYADVIRLNPGVNVDRGETQGRALALTVYGATSVENQFIIDGVNTTNVIKGFQGKAINSEFIQEVEVKTGGYQAEYGRALGGVINVITKSGGNAFHGDAFSYYDGFSRGLNTRSSQKITPNDSLTGMRIADYQRNDFGADLGGYIWKDRIWFFSAYDHIKTPGEVSRYVSTSVVPNTAKFPLTEKDNLYSGKLTFNLLPQTTLVATGFSDPTVISGAAGSDPHQSRVRQITSFDPRTWESQRNIGGLDFGLRLDQLFGAHGVLGIQASQHKDRYQLQPSGAGSGVRTDDFTCSGGTQTKPCVEPSSSKLTTGGFGQIFGPTLNNFSVRNQARGDFTFYAGSHEAKVGADYATGKTTAITFYTGKQSVEKHNEYGQTYYVHNFFASSAADLTPIDNTVVPKTVDWGWYAQDSWKIVPTITLNAGLRWDREDIKDYTGTTVISTTNEWQPRLGLIWDPQGNGASKVYGSVGRFYYAIPTDLNVRAYGAQTQATTYNFSPTDTAQDATVFGHSKPFIQGGAFTEPADAGLKGIYQDEYTAGIEKLLDPTLSVGFKITYRALKSAIEDRCDLDYTAPINNGNTCAITNPGGKGLWASGNVPGCNGLDGDAFNCSPTIPALPKVKRVYKGIEFTGRKSLSQNLWAQASYVFSSLRGNYDGEVREGRGQTDPGINADFDYYLFQHNVEGRLFLDRPHNIRFDAAYTTPFKLFVGFGAYVQSGAPLNKQGYFNSGYGAEIQLVPRGTAKRLPTQYEANVTLGYPLRFGGVTITPQLYVFNILNKQQEVLEDVRWSTSQPAGYLNCANTSNPGCTIFDPNQQQTNKNYGKVTARQEPRLMRGAIKVTW